MTTLALVASLFGLPAFAGGPPVPAAEPWKTDRALVILHRAASMAAPENTAASLEEAVRQGADGVEIDVRETVDGELVLYHDDWVMLPFGPGGRIENTRKSLVGGLDVGQRWGPRWKGTRIPLFQDALKFAVANDLLLWLDIKTPGLYAKVMRAVEAVGARRLVRNAADPTTAERIRFSGTWLAGYNHTGGGEEDPERVARLVKSAPAEFAVMPDDARAWSRALGRRPERRKFTPFRDTWDPGHRGMIANKPPGIDLEILGMLGEPLGKMAKGNYATQASLERVAATSESAYARMAALTGLSRFPNPTSLALLEAALAKPSPVDPKNDPEMPSFPYFAFFRKAAAATGLARMRTPEARAALRRLAAQGESERASVAIALSTHGDAADLPYLAELAAPGQPGMVASFALSHVGRFGTKAEPVFRAALRRTGYERKLAVFGLALLGPEGGQLAEKIAADATENDHVRRGARLAAAWAKEGRGSDEGRDD